MLSVVIATQDDALPLVRTLAALVPGATAGVVREVLIADAGSRDDTAEVADIAGCRLLATGGPLGARLATAAAEARSEWLLFLNPGTVLDSTWITESRGFVESSELSGRAGSVAAVFRRVPAADVGRPALLEAVWTIAAALASRPDPAQGLLIAGRLYRRLGGHRADVEDPQHRLLRRLGRRQLVTLRSGAAYPPA